MADKKMLKIETIVKASENLKEVATTVRPEDETDFIKANMTKKVIIKNDDRDKGTD